MMYVDCQCGQEVKAADHVAGTLRRCPRCGEKVQFPTNPQEARRTPAISATASAVTLHDSINSSHSSAQTTPSATSAGPEGFPSTPNKIRAKGQREVAPKPRFLGVIAVLSCA